MGKSSKHPFHAEACRIRRMTDEQLEAYLKELSEKADRTDGLEKELETLKVDESRHRELALEARKEIDGLKAENAKLKKQLEEKPCEPTDIKKAIEMWLILYVLSGKGFGSKTVDKLIKILQETPDRDLENLREVHDEKILW